MKRELKRTVQCAKCPWKKGVDPHDIPNGYTEERHCNLRSTIAEPGEYDSIGKPLKVMGCHEEHEEFCIGWLVNQLGPGNNIALRIAAMSISNMRDVRTVGEQHETFEDTLPS